MSFAPGTVSTAIQSLLRQHGIGHRVCTGAPEGGLHVWGGDASLGRRVPPAPRTKLHKLLQGLPRPEPKDAKMPMSHLGVDPGSLKPPGRGFRRQWPAA